MVLSIRTLYNVERVEICFYPILGVWGVARWAWSPLPLQRDALFTIEYTIVN
jgi:hypothetical protein